MKILKRNILSLFAIIALICSCEKTSPFDDVQIVTNTSDIMHTSVTLQIKNAKNGNILGLEGETMNLRITGPDADDVFDITGMEQNTFTISKGLMSFGIYSNREATLDNPIRFNIVVESEGFLEASVPVQIFGKGRTSKELLMIEFGDTPKGISYVQEQIPAENGKLNEDLIIESGTVEGENGSTKATVKAPTGLVIKDENGVPLGNVLHMDFVYFNSDPETTNAYPGGMLAEVEDNGDDPLIAFHTAGFVTINIVDGNGNKARFFDYEGEDPSVEEGLEVEIEIDPNLYNFEEGRTIESGDIIPMWSFETETGIWTREHDAEIIFENGKWLSRTVFPHLSSWNWDWFNNGCYTGPTLCFTSNSIPEGTLIGARFEVISNTVNSFTTIDRNGLKIGDCIPLIRVPNSSAIIKATYQFDCGYEDIIIIDNLCQGGQFDFDVNPYVGELTEITLNIDGYCPDSDILIRPTFPFFYKNLESSCGYWQEAMFDNGTATIQVVKGQLYRFMIYYNGNWIEHDTVIHVGDDIGCNNIPFSSEICSFFR